MASQDLVKASRSQLNQDAAHICLANDGVIRDSSWEEAHRFLHGPQVCGRAQLEGGVREEADVARAVAALSAQLRAVLAGVQVALVDSVCVRALHSLQPVLHFSTVINAAVPAGVLPWCM